MPRPVCVPCKREMTLVKSVTVQLNALAVGGAYQQYQGDLARCEGCGAEVVDRFGRMPTWESHSRTEPAKADVVIEERRGR